MKKVSEIALGVEIRIETPTDAINVWPLNRTGGQEWHRDNYLRWHGDVNVEYDCTHNVYRVAAFKQQRDSYISAKAESCRRWGSN